MLLKYITLFSCFDFLLLAIALFLKPHFNRQSGKILFILILLMATYSGVVYIHYSLLIHRLNHLLAFYSPIDGLLFLLLSPCLYFYVLSVLQQPFRLFTWRSLLHLIPLLPCVIFIFRFWTYTYTQRIEWLIRDFQIGTQETTLLNIVLYAQIFGYLCICYRLIKKQPFKQGGEVNSDLRTEAWWLKIFVITNLTYLILSAPCNFYFGNEQADIIIGQLAMGIQFLYLFFKSVLTQDASSGVVKTHKKDNTFKIEDTMADNYQTKLLAFMETNKPYRRFDYTILMLAKEMNIPEHHLSIVLNGSIKKTFTEFMNEYKVAEAKQMLCDPKFARRTIESIALDCGFGVKSTFNRVFLKHTGNTPTDYRRHYQHENSDNPVINSDDSCNE